MINLSGHKWTAPKSLYEMFGIDENSGIVLPSNYFYEVLDPTEMTLEEIEEYKTEIAPVLAFLAKGENKVEATELVEKYKDMLVHASPSFKKVYKVFMIDIFEEFLEPGIISSKEEVSVEQIVNGILSGSVISIIKMHSEVINWSCKIAHKKALQQKSDPPVSMIRYRRITL